MQIPESFDAPPTAENSREELRLIAHVLTDIADRLDAIAAMLELTEES